MSFYRGVCFDLHHTLVDPEFRLRPGTGELFEHLKKSGIAIILTTTGGGQHIQDVMRDTGIKKDITSVFEGPQINIGMGKLYAPAAATLGLSPREAPHKLIATGDLLDDQPADIPIVFVYHPGGYQFDASLLDHLIHHLLKEGKDSFISGFDKIMNDHRKPVRIPGSKDAGIRAVMDGISVTLSFRDPTAGGTKLPQFTPGIHIPTITVVSAERYRR